MNDTSIFDAAYHQERCLTQAMAQDVERQRSRPSMLLRPSLTIDGNQWCALYGANLQDGVCGFGDSPELAMADFDFNWKKSLVASPIKPEPQAEPKWRCFHCDEAFTEAEDAETHFGKSEHSQPACQIDAAEYRAMEERMRRYNEEDSDLHRTMYGMQSDHQTALQREEEKGYARGLKDGMVEPQAPSDALK